MPTNNPLLSLFKEQLESECQRLASDHGLEDRGHYLIYWFFMKLLGFSAADVEEVFCDGGGDLGINAIRIDDEDIVHFYQFKHPKDSLSNFPAGDVDKMISGLRLILSKNHAKIANPELKARLEEVYQMVPKGYRIHLVTSGAGIPKEAVLKLNALTNALKGPSAGMVEWDEVALEKLQEQFSAEYPCIKRSNSIRCEEPAVYAALWSGRLLSFSCHGEEPR
jgi:hypothetical protein